MARSRHQPARDQGRIGEPRRRTLRLRGHLDFGGGHLYRLYQRAGRISDRGLPRTGLRPWGGIDRLNYNRFMLLEGICPAATTPFYPDGRLYLKKLEHNVQRYSRTLVSGIV